jgi:transposase
VTKLRDRFGLARVVLVGDRGMLTETQLESLRQVPGIGWVSALRGPAIRALVEQGALQLSLFDQKNLAEITAPEYPGERLIACFNPLLAEERQRKRTALLEATERAYQKIAREVARRRKTPLTAAEIGVKVGRVRNRFKMGKHFALTIADGVFHWTRLDEAIRREAALDGLYVIRTSEPASQLSAADTVRTYKGLAQVERVFRCLKGIDLRVRPIYHRIPPRVRAHFFLCLLAYYVEWHLREAWRPLLFEDEQLTHTRGTRDPVAPARPSPAAQRKKAQRTTADGLPLQSFDTLLAALGTRCRVTGRLTADPAAPRIQQLTELTPLQARAMELLQL